MSLSTKLPPTFIWPTLPVLDKEDEFIRIIQENQVVILQGETGSGKTTQIPKLCIKAGLADNGLIGCTQPRRIAALSICDRLRHECQNKDLIGAQIRFHVDCPKDMLIKIMTDGILLQEYQKDPLLKKYSAIIIDEAHERSLNIDILLGILNLIRHNRPNLKIIITSATIDAQSFSEFFDNAPIIVAEGKAFPVDIEYWDEKDNPDIDPIVLASQAIHHLQDIHEDHLLCFLPTEKDILELQQVLEGSLGAHFIILPLYGRLSPGDQKAIFNESGKIKIVLATNIAETSITIPGIAYVVDLGLARVSRYHSSTRIQGLPIEKISQASTRQRSGRAGRVKPGHCIRLYSSDDFKSRPEYTDPEILRSNLSNVMLTMMDLGLDLERFPLLEAPKTASIRGARIHLFELGALNSTTPSAKMTPLGKKMLRIPVDVTLSHLLIKAQEKNVLAAALVIASGLSIQEARIFPRDPQERSIAEGMHAKVRHKKSDFISLILLWNKIFTEMGDEWTLNKLRKFCTKNHLVFLRVREWIQLYQQFARLMKFKDESGNKKTENKSSDTHQISKYHVDLKTLHEDHIHQVLLSAYLGTLARIENNEKYYRLASGREAWIFPGSVLFKKSPEWILASEIRETSKVWLAKNCEIKSEWILQVASQFCKTVYEHIKYNHVSGFVEALCITTFKGLRIGTPHRVQYQNINQEETRKALWLEAIVQNKASHKPAFMHHNLRVLKGLAELETQMRRSGLVPDDTQVLEWYLEKIAELPEVIEITDFKRLSAYIKKNKLNLHFSFSKEEWIERRSVEDSWFNEFTQDSLPQNQLSELFPKEVIIGQSRQKVKYQFDHQREDDGISIEIDRDVLLHSTWSEITNSVPGWLHRLMDYIIGESSKTQRNILEKYRPSIILEWTKRMKVMQTSAFLVLAYVLEEHEGLANEANFDPCLFTLSKKKQNHLNLNFIIQPHKLKINLEPSSGPSTWFRKKVQLIEKTSTDATALVTGPAELSYGLMQTGKTSYQQKLSLMASSDKFWTHLVYQTQNQWKQSPHQNWSQNFIDRWNFKGREAAWLLLGALTLEGKSKAQIDEWENEHRTVQKSQTAKLKKSQSKVRSLSDLSKLSELSEEFPSEVEGFQNEIKQLGWAKELWAKRYHKPQEVQTVNWKNSKKLWRKIARERLAASPHLAPLNESMRSTLDLIEESSQEKAPPFLLTLLCELEEAELALYSGKRVSKDEEPEIVIESDALLALKNKWKP